MKYSRRNFLQTIFFGSGFLFLPWLSIKNVLAKSKKFFLEKFPQADGKKNIFMAFNNIKDPENGESDEYSTIRQLHKILEELKVPPGASVIGIGARSGTPEDVFGAPGEMGYLWRVGTSWDGVVTDHRDASGVPLGLDDPMVVTQVGVLHESTAHHLEYNDASQEGRVLWTFYNDETGKPELGLGMHNIFEDVDGGLLDAIYKTSREALKKPNSWASSRVRKKLAHFIPDLNKDAVWNNFADSLASPHVHSQWMDYVRKEKWQGAAIVLKGSMANIAQFHLREWVRKSPSEPEFEIGRGTHTALRVRTGREVRPFITTGEDQWTMVGFLYDLDNKTSVPAMKEYRDFADIFGQDFHIHGFKNNNSVGGHTLFAMMGQGPLSVSLYPLEFFNGKSAFLFNNDLIAVKRSLQVTDNEVSVLVQNEGENFVRNIAVTLTVRDPRGLQINPEHVTIPFMNPGEVKRVTFRGSTARNSFARRRITVDRKANLFEGGEGKKNNFFEF